MARTVSTTQAPQTPEPVDVPVYDERGNVRPRGTEGARPMTYTERVAIAADLAADAES